MILLGNVSSKDLEFQNYTLGDINVIELLLSLRYKYDENMFMDAYAPAMVVSGAGVINEEVVSTYASLDKYIERCNFNEEQLSILRLISEGYSHEEIAFELDLLTPTITGRLNTMYKRIIKENERQWRRVIYNEKLGLRNKRCSKCKEQLPATAEFYSDYNRSRDGFHSICKTCRL